MSLIRYVGAHDEVTITVAGHDIDVANGATVDVPNEVAAGFLEQPDNWQPVATKAKGDNTKDGE